MSPKKITKLEFSDESAEATAEIVVCAKAHKEEAEEPLYITRV